MNGTNQNQSLGKSLGYYFIRLTIYTLTGQNRCLVYWAVLHDIVCVHMRVKASFAKFLNHQVACVQRTITNVLQNTIICHLETQQSFIFSLVYFVDDFCVDRFLTSIQRLNYSTISVPDRWLTSTNRCPMENRSPLPSINFGIRCWSEKRYIFSFIPRFSPKSCYYTSRSL